MKKFNLLLLLLFVQSISDAKEMYIKVSLADCVNCYQGITIIQQELIPRFTDVYYIFESKYKQDLNLLVEKFNIQLNKEKVLFSDSLYRNIGKVEYSELVIRDRDRIYQIPIKNITKEETAKILENLQGSKIVNFPITEMPSSFSLIAQGQNIIVKNLIDNSYTLYVKGIKICTLKSNPDSIYKQLYKQFPLLNDGNDYIKIAKDNIALNPQINYAIKSGDSTFAAFMNIFFIDKFDKVINDIVVKKVLFIARTNGLRYKFYRLNDEKILQAGYNINEYSNFTLYKNELTVGINRQYGIIDSATHFLATFTFNKEMDNFEFNKIEPFFIL